MALARSFIYASQLTVAATPVSSTSFLVGVGQSFKLDNIFVDNSSSSLYIIGLRDSTGLQYVSAGTSNPIPIAQAAYPSKPNHLNAFAFVEPLMLVGQLQFLVDVQNTGGSSQTINFAFVGYMQVGGG